MTEMHMLCLFTAGQSWTRLSPVIPSPPFPSHYTGACACGRQGRWERLTGDWRHPSFPGYTDAQRRFNFRRSVGLVGDFSVSFVSSASTLRCVSLVWQHDWIGAAGTTLPYCLQLHVGLVLSAPASEHLGTAAGLQWSGRQVLPEAT